MSGASPKGPGERIGISATTAIPLRLAPNHELTIAVLEQAAEALQAHLT